MSQHTKANRQAIAEAFEQFMEGDAGPFFSMVADDVRWTVIGSTDISGTFTSKSQFIAEATSKITAGLDGAIAGSIRSIFADGDHVIVQWDGKAKMVSGRDYDQTYCWVMRLDGGKVVETVAYLDTEMVSAVFEK